MPDKKPVSFESEGIVDFGKRIFDDYYSKRITLEELISIIDKSGAEGNDMAVLGCYCETDEEVTFQLHKLETFKDAKQSHEDEFTSKIAVVIMMNEIEKSGISLDRYFRCDRFAKMIVEEYRKAWGDDYPKLLAELEKTVKHFNFPSWNQIFEKYIQ